MTGMQKAGQYKPEGPAPRLKALKDQPDEAGDERQKIRLAG